MQMNKLSLETGGNEDIAKVEGKTRKATFSTGRVD